jgi:bis(5'-nucleosyl)-tetraphosphatase (symmetrical)
VATYAIGDVQGCATTLERLVARIAFDPAADRLWFAGDLVNRGPRSLEVLRWVEGLGDRATVVLGNHELKLLAQAGKLWKRAQLDTLDDVLAAPDLDRLIEWTCSRPLAHREGGWLMVHGGVYPSWDARLVMELAAEASDALRSEPARRAALVALKAERPASWSDDLRGPSRIAAVLAGFTRLRTVDAEGRSFEFNGAPEDAPAGCVPWFDAPGRRTRDVRIVAGHWSALGLLVRPDLVAIDTGCVWGRELTAYRLEDGAIFQEPCADGLPASPASGPRAGNA